MGLLSSLLEPLTGSGAAATAASDANYRGMQAEREMYDIGRGDVSGYSDRALSELRGGTERGVSALTGYGDKAAGELKSGYTTGRDVLTSELGRTSAEGAPWSKFGTDMASQYGAGASEGFKFDLSSDPVYGERIKELDKLMANSQSAKGMKFSGSTLSKLRDATATEIGSSYGRQFDKYQSNLANLYQGAQLGGNMTSSLWSNRGNLAGGVAGADIGYGTAASGATGAIGGNLANLYNANSGNVAQTLMSTGQTLGNMAVGQGSNLAQGFQNQGAIQAQAATAPFQNLLAIGQTVGSLMGGGGGRN